MTDPKKPFLVQEGFLIRCHSVRAYQVWQGENFTKSDGKYRMTSAWVFYKAICFCIISFRRLIRP